MCCIKSYTSGDLDKAARKNQRTRNNQVMTAKEYLKQYEWAVKRAQRYEEEYQNEALLIDAVKSLSDNDGMPHGSGISKPTEEKAIRLADKKLRLIEAKLEAIAIRQEIFDTIDRVDGIEGDVLYERYIKLHKWEDICVLLHYSWYGVHNAHRRALKIVEDMNIVKHFYNV